MTIEKICHTLVYVGSKRFSGAKVRTAREAVYLSQEEVAEVLKVTPRTIYNWEHELFFPDAEDLPKLAEALGKPVEWFFVERGDA